MTRVKMIFGKHFRFSLSSFLTGALSGLTIKIFGSVYIGEILSLFFFAASQGTGKRPFSLIPKPIFVLALLWAAAQACSDIVNNTEFADSLKGIGAPVLMLFSMAGLSSFFSRDHRRCPSFLLGLPLGLFVDVVLLNPTYYFLTDNQWKWGYGSNIMSFTIVLTSFFVKQSKSFLDHFSIFLVLAGLSIIGLLNESRSSLSVLITYGLFLLLRIRFFQGLLNSMNRIRPAGTYLLISFVSAGLIVLSLSLGYIFINTPIASLLPHATYQKTFKQAQSSLGLLAGGRSEFLASSVAFLDKPLLGHGSWAKDPTGEYNSLRLKRAQEFGEELDYDLEVLTSQQPGNLLIPAHSFLFGSLVWCGVFGGLFWLSIIYWLADLFLRFNPLLNFFFFNGIVALLWGILFSPFAYVTRFSTSVFLASLIAFICLANAKIPKSTVIKQ